MPLYVYYRIGSVILARSHINTVESQINDVVGQQQMYP